MSDCLALQCESRSPPTTDSNTCSSSGAASRPTKNETPALLPAERHSRPDARPQCVASAARDPLVAFRLPEELLDRLRQRADVQGRPVSELLREALQWLLSDQRKRQRS